MKQSLFFSILVAVTLSACNKDIKIPVDVPPADDTTSYLQVTASGVTLAGVQHHAILSIRSTSGDTIINNKKVMLDNISGSYKTEKIKLAPGNYELISFLVVKNSDTASYAAPKSNSPKASLVSKALPLRVTVTGKEVSTSPVEVLNVLSSDVPEAFGYNNTEFGFEPFMRVGVTISMLVGQVRYDSLAGLLSVNAHRKGGGDWSRQVDLRSGVTFLNIPTGYDEYRFSSVKWNTSLNSTLSPEQFEPGKLVVLSGTKTPKRLVEEAAFVESSQGFVPESRTEYDYNSSGLQEIRSYQKSLTVSGLPLTHVYQFVYAGNLPDTIYRKTPDGNISGFTAYTYAGSRIVSMANRSSDRSTYAAIEYSGSDRREIIQANYLFDNNHSMFYSMTFEGGNKIADFAQSSTGSGESGTYAYDNNINPYYFLGYPDLYFSRSSKNNLTFENKSYGAIPTIVPYKWVYTYDPDGYPSEVLISYKGYTSQQHLYRIKKVFRYN